jgi:hypothetical protein
MIVKTFQSRQTENPSRSWSRTTAWGLEQGQLVVWTDESWQTTVGLVGL